MSDHRIATHRLVRLNGERPALYRITIILGTRPEAIKLAPVILALREHHAFEARVCVTAQHRQMLDQALSAFDLVPHADFDLMRPDQTLGGFAARCLEAIDGYLDRERPDLLLIQGDTTTALTAALSAFYHQIAIGHVEAGLRTGHLDSPWPEEGNRAMISRLANLHFAHTETARRHLLTEGIPANRIHVTGNTVIDALNLALEKVRASPPAVPGLPAAIWAEGRNEPLVLITAHRRESFGAELESICRAVAILARKFPGTQFVYALHLNPHIREPVRRILGATGAENLHLIDPVPYLSFVALMDRATLILTDSGGIQEEAPCLGKPVLVMRQSTERPEVVAAGTVRLVGTEVRRIVAETALLLTDCSAYTARARVYSPYGDGKATERILAACLAFCESQRDPTP
jgi:UDP-N-acetylglucosamine 2-epimerase (non-hydrolysing)